MAYFVALLRIIFATRCARRVGGSENLIYFLLASDLFLSMNFLIFSFENPAVLRTDSVSDTTIEQKNIFQLMIIMLLAEY